MFLGEFFAWNIPWGIDADRIYRMCAGRVRVEDASIMISIVRGQSDHMRPVCPVNASVVQKYADAFEMTPRLNDLIGSCSHGMKQKIMVISVLMRRPEVIFLDEPTVGLDARSAKILKMLLEKYKNEGSTIFMTTHVLEIAEKMCDRIGIINKGKLISEGTMNELRRKAGADERETLENLFLQLTGEDEDIQEIVSAL